jgi:GNAT superfamily N-acetyltransferase
MAGREYKIMSQPGYEVDYTKANLIQLLKDGYGLPNDIKQEELTAHIQFAYNNASKVYFALDKNGSEMGSLSVRCRPNTENDPFWQTLQLLLQKEIDMNFLACEMYGIVVHPTVRREGVASRLLSEMIEDLNPHVIFGQTNVPEVVLLRSQVAKLHSYRTFYGFCEITPSLDYEKVSDGRPFVHASLISQEAEPIEHGIYTISTHILPSNIPNTDDFPLQIQKAFEPVQKAQRAIGGGQTTVTSLVSVQDRLLKKLYK